jgi:hypothetical protein
LYTLVTWWWPKRAETCSDNKVMIHLIRVVYRRFTKYPTLWIYTQDVPHHIKVSTLTHTQPSEETRDINFFFFAIMVRRSVHREWCFWKTYPWASAESYCSPVHRGMVATGFYIIQATSSMQMLFSYVNCFVLYYIFCAIIMFRWTATWFLNYLRSILYLVVRISPWMARITFLE